MTYRSQRERGELGTLCAEEREKESMKNRNLVIAAVDPYLWRASLDAPVTRGVVPDCWDGDIALECNLNSGHVNRRIEQPFIHNTAQKSHPALAIP